METEWHNSAVELANYLKEWKAENVMAVQLAPSVSWADYCVIATCYSLTHTRGILRQLRSLLRENAALSALSGSLHTLGALGEDSGWCLVDMGPLVVHLMSAEARAFYELEQLWPVVKVLPIPN